MYEQMSECKFMNSSNITAPLINAADLWIWTISFEYSFLNWIESSTSHLHLDIAIWFCIFTLAITSNI